MLFRSLHRELRNKIYRHSNYTDFYIKDPKLRHIHKAEVKDRVVHHAVYRILYPIFDKSFIFDSYSCRNNKGTHKAVLRLVSFARKGSKNFTKPYYYLKCDIKKFFDSVGHKILIECLKIKINDADALLLLEGIIGSFGKDEGRGLPLGNLTSQLFANIYLNELDQFVKHNLKIKYYIRYCDDFLILDSDREHLANLVSIIEKFLQTKLKLSLNQNKVFISKLSQGIDFLGYVVLPHYRVLRTRTKKRMFKKLGFKRAQLSTGEISGKAFEQARQSYLGILSHCQSQKLKQKLGKI